MDNISNNALLYKLGGLPKEAWGVSVLAATSMTILLAILMIWSLVWKGMALWKAARNGSKVWFVVILLVNTLGLLDILYYFYISKKRWGKGKKA